MPAALISRGEVLDHLTEAFRVHGFEGASIARLSEATGLGKASLYHYFHGGKQEMARAVVAHLGESFQRLVLAPLRTSGDPAQRLNAMILGVDQFYDRGEAACIVDLFGIGGAGEMFREPLAGAVQAFTDAVAGVVAETGLPADLARRRAEDAFVALQGALVVARATGDRTVFKRTLSEIPGRLLAAA